MKRKKKSDQLLDKRDFWVLPCKSIGEFALPFRDIGGGRFCASYCSYDPSMIVFSISVVTILSLGIVFRVLFNWGPRAGAQDIIVVLISFMLISVLLNRAFHYKKLVILIDSDRSKFDLYTIRLSLRPIRHQRLNPKTVRVSSYSCFFCDAFFPTSKTNSSYMHSVCIEDDKYFFFALITNDAETMHKYLEYTKCLSGLALIRGRGGYINIKINIARALAFS
jgi:hypothetical protein